MTTSFAMTTRFGEICAKQSFSSSVPPVNRTGVRLSKPPKRVRPRYFPRQIVLGPFQTEGQPTRSGRYKTNTTSAYLYSESKAYKRADIGLMTIDDCA